MSRSQSQSAILLGVILVVLTLGAGVAWWLSRAEATPLDQHVAREPTAPVEVERIEDDGSARSELVEQAPSVQADGELISTVLYPLELELELLQADLLREIGGDVVIGAGADARLAGRIVDARGGGVAAEVHFVHGPNTGRVLRCDGSGAFGATDLYPGLDIVEVRGPAIIGSRREVRLRRGTEQLLNIGYGRPAVVQGTVQDRAGEPIEGARVRIDGQSGTTASDGTFYIDRVASGRTIVEVEAEGYTPLREDFAVTAGQSYPLGRLTYTLQEPSSLEISIPEAVGGPGPALVYLLPTNTRVARTYPWYSVSPVEVLPGTTHRIEGLPSTVVEVRVFKHGAIASPPRKSVNLRGGEEHFVEVHLESAGLLSGTVVRDGRPVSGARVRLEAPDRVAATLSLHREQAMFLESEVMHPLPPAVQDVRTDAAGRFVLTDYSDLAPQRYLEAEGPEGGWAARLVGPDEEHVELELTARPPGRGRFVMHLPGRRQGLPVLVTVNGQPREEFLLPDWESLVVEGLEPGTWVARASWYSQPLLEEQQVEVRPEFETEVELPLPAIEGHSREEWRRAGRPYPGGP